MSEFRVWKIGDLGIAKISRLDNNLTKIGTPGYIAPEMQTGIYGPYDEKVDIWATGVMFIMQIERWVGRKVFEKLSVRAGDDR